MMTSTSLDVICPHPNCSREACGCLCWCDQFGEQCKPHRKYCWYERRGKNHCFVVDVRGKTHTAGRSEMLRPMRLV